jgi:uncharacterized protein (TIGR02646 family)
VRRIVKSGEPKALTQWKTSNPRLQRYADLNHKRASDAIKAQGKSVINAIRSQNVKDQLGLCAYCMCRIENREDSAMNEHVEARNSNHSRELDFSNIVASCTIKKQCDDAHDSQPLPLHPLMDECENGFEYRLNGKIIGKTENARTTIKVLNLGDSHQSNRSLIMQRKQHIEAFLMYDQGLELDNLEFDEDIRQLMLEEITTVENDCLPPFSPVIVNIIEQVL